ncbi:MerR family transcriptional regulator [Agromyces bauzanensis]
MLFPVAGTPPCLRMLRSGVKISEAARASGASARSLRFYEDQGLIVPGRCGNGYRDYCRSTIDQVLAIRSLLGSGLSVRLIRELLPRLGDRPGVGADPIRAEFLDEVQRYRHRLSARIAVLETQRSALDAFLDQGFNARIDDGT